MKPLRIKLSSHFMENLMRVKHGAIEGAASLTGKRFGVLVASSLVATSAVVAGALTGAGDSDALASLLARQLGTANEAPAVSESSSAPPSGGEQAAPRGGPGAAGAAPSPSGPVEEPTPAPPEEPATPATYPEAGPVKHVFLISLASPGYEASFGTQSQMPYLATTLRPQGELLSNYTLLTEGALANGIAAISGQPPNAATDAGCPSFGDVSPPTADAKGAVRGTGCVYPVETLTIADQLTPARLSWRAYAEGMADPTGKPAGCVHPDQGEPASGTPGGYAATQNPFVYFHSLLDLGDCTANDVPIDGLSADLKKANKTPAYSFIAPTPCDAGFTGQCASGAPEGAAAADAFLEEWVPKILASPAYADGGLLVVAFSAVDPEVPEASASGEGRLKTGALLVSPLLTAGATDAAPYGPYSLLRSTEDLFGLRPLALAAAAKTRSFAASLLGESRGD